MSGILFNAGFFPPSDHEIWNEELKWQPVPIHTSPASLDNVNIVQKFLTVTKSIIVTLKRKDSMA